MRKIKYIKVPKDIIYNYTVDKEIGEVKVLGLGNERVALYSYLYCQKSGMGNTVGFSNSHMAEWCGYKPNTNKGKINDRLKQSLYVLRDARYLDIPTYTDKDGNTKGFYPIKVKLIVCFMLMMICLIQIVSTQLYI